MGRVVTVLEPLGEDLLHRPVCKVTILANACEPRGSSRHRVQSILMRSLEIGRLLEIIKIFHAALVAHEGAINQLNVFPVPDGDTGTNMRSTIDAVLATVEDTEGDPFEIAASISRGALLGARGNSGIILAQYLRAFVAAMRENAGVDAAGLVRALEEAEQAARAAVALPTEGTILSIAGGAARAAATALGEGAEFAEVVARANEGAVAALFATPSQLAVLAHTGVVDAGGAGLTLFYGAIVSLTAQDHRLPELQLPEGVREVISHTPRVMHAGYRIAQIAEDANYEVMFLLEASEEAMITFRATWEALGNSIVIIGEAPIWNCHVHTTQIGRAIEAGITAGRPYQIHVTDLDRQVAEEAWVRHELPRTSPNVGAGAASAECAVVAVTNGEGLRQVFISLGVQHFIEGGASMNPSTAELVAALDAVDAQEVLLLADHKNVFAVAREAVKLSHHEIAVLECANAAEGISAMLQFDATKSITENRATMAAHLGSVASGEVTAAVRDATTEAGVVNRGDLLALDHHEIIAIEQTITAAAVALVRHLVRDNHEIATLYSGEGVSIETVEAVVAALSESHPHLTVEYFAGGQLHPILLVALE